MTTTTRLQQLRGKSEVLWSAAVDTCIDCEGNVQEDRRSSCEDAREEALAEWNTAINAVERGDIATAREALRSARRLGDEWGDSAQETAALDLLDCPRMETYAEMAQRLGIPIEEVSARVDRMVTAGTASVSGYSLDGSTPLADYEIEYSV